LGFRDRAGPHARRFAEDAAREAFSARGVELVLAGIGDRVEM
jgi:hypothetical protein